MKRWIDYKNGNTIGTTGSEGGVILKEETFDGGCLITLEECKRYHAITYHIHNPNATSNKNLYLDKDGNPVGILQNHIYCLKEVNKHDTART